MRRTLLYPASLALLIAAVSMTAPARLQAQQAPVPAVDPQSLSELVTAIVLDNIPVQYEDDRRWGKQKEVVSGLKVRLDGLQLKTKRRRKDVNHGTWQRYKVQLYDPDNWFEIRIEDLTFEPGGKVRFQAVCTSTLLVEARVQEWQRGIRLYSVSTDAVARVRLRMDCSLGLRFDTGRFPPDVILEPEIHQADLKLKEFRVKRISHLEGHFAKEIGDLAAGLVREKLDDNEKKLVAKINDRIEKNRDDLRYSFADFASRKWREVTGE